MSHLCGVLSLPAFVVHAPRLLAKIQSEDLSLKDLAELLRLDPGIGARLLHMANSPFFGVNGQISSVEEALLVLGMRRARELIHAHILQSLISTQPWHHVDLDKFWKHSLRVAVTSQAVAKQVGFTDSDAFIAGLFHNLGCLVLLQYQSNDYAKILSQLPPYADLLQFEMECFQTTHADIGANVLAQWNFPADICDAISLQYQSPNDLHSTFQQLLQFSVHFSVPEQTSEVGLYQQFKNLGMQGWVQNDFTQLSTKVDLGLGQLVQLLGE
ncbi:MAG: HDOD domain-containing protein [Burkholderiales bacterium]|jgi:HD-like signal output (HDOD) protein|uniref:HDOD domain-containing protein n=1 Tax=Limnobacter sp. TaxID=2003368 RepID=UPI0039BCCB27|nr:HDOD domain-containing protein [Burkholderiales bacterium]